MENKSINIEIGARTDPVLGRLREEYTNNRTALLVDKRYWPRHHWGWRREADSQLPYVQADTQGLPFMAGSVDLLASKDMFCAEGFITNDEKGNTSTEHVGDIKAIATEWFRVAKPGAQAVLIEEATPDEGLLGRLDQAFLAAGFTRTEADLFPDERINELLKPEYHDNSYSLGSFGVIYHKA